MNDTVKKVLEIMQGEYKKRGNWWYFIMWFLIDEEWNTNLEHSMSMTTNDIIIMQKHLNMVFDALIFKDEFDD